jgi:hypothetical protein
MENAYTEQTDTLDLIKIKTSALQKKGKENEKTGHRLRENICKSYYLIKSFLSHIKSY